MATRKDSQLSAMAGEFLTVGKLFKREYQASVTLGNAKSVDVLAYNPKTNRSFVVQVKTLRDNNCFPMSKDDISPDQVYVFVILHAPDQSGEFFIVPGAEILADVNKCFGTCYTRQPQSTFPAVNYGPLKLYKDNWQVFRSVGGSYGKETGV